MFGCLKGLISFIFFALAVVGFFTLGGDEILMHGLNGYMHPTPEIVAERANKLADFSHIPTGYKVDNAVNILGVKAATANYKPTGQTMAVVDTGWALKISKKDVKSDNMSDKLHELVSKFMFQPVKINNIEILNQSSFKMKNQEIPYVKVKVDLSGSKNETVEGIIGVADTENEKQKLLVSFNKENKFNNKVAEKFFNSISIK